MALQHWWWIAAVALAVAEMMSASFYLLVLAIAAALTGVLAWAGFGISAQLVFAAVASVIGVLALHQYKKRFMQKPPKLANNLDIGQSVEVLVWLGEEGQARVFYRGTQWDARLQDLDAPRQNRMRIVGNEGSTFLIAPFAQ